MGNRCSWHAIEECGKLVTALDKNEHKVFWKPDKARPVKEASSRVVRWWLLMGCFLSFLACKIMQWTRSCIVSMMSFWGRMHLSPKQMFQFSCMWQSSSNHAVASKVKTVFEERRYLTAILYSGACIALQYVHLLQWISPVLRELKIDIFFHCCVSVEDAQEHDMATAFQTLVSILFLLHCSLARRHNRWAVNVMVWCVVIARFGAEAHGYTVPECGKSNQPSDSYQEVAARFFLFMCIHPLHGCILAVVQSLAHVALFVQHVPADNARLFCASCQRRVPLADLGDNVLSLISLASNYKNIGGLGHDFIQRFLHELQSILDQNPRNKFIAEEAATMAILIVCLLAVNLLIRHLVVQTVNLEDMEGQLRAVSNVLGLLCDAVVHLGPELRIVAPAPKLVALLNTASRPNAYLGENFEDFIASDEDRCRVKQVLNKSSTMDISDSPFVANVLQIGMRDASGIAFKVELFHTWFQSVDGQTRYVVGMNEVGERLHQEPMPSTNQTWMNSDLPEQSVSDTSASEQSLDALASALPLWFATDASMKVVQSGMVKIGNQEEITTDDNRIINMLKRENKFATWVAQTTCSMLDDDQVAQPKNESFQIKSNSWPDLNMPPCSMTVRAAAARVDPGSVLGVEHSASSLVRFDLSLQKEDE